MSIVYLKLRFYLIVLSPHSTDIPMKDCVAYEGVEVHSGMEGGIYEDPQWHLLIQFNFVLDIFFFCLDSIAKSKIIFLQYQLVIVFN